MVQFEIGMNDFCCKLHLHWFSDKWDFSFNVAPPNKTVIKIK